MATLSPGTEVSIEPRAASRLSFPPPDRATLLVCVHEAALRAPQSRSTQLVGFDAGEPAWAGALDERDLSVERDGGGDPRALLADAVGAGPRLWEVVWPGDLLRDPERGGLETVYRGERPWLVVGGVPSGDLLAAPLNDATNPKWYTPVLEAEDVDFAGSTKRAQLELAHLWTLPESLGAIGEAVPAVRDTLLEALRAYF